MSPLLNKNHSNQDLDDSKFVRDGERIAFFQHPDKYNNFHLHIAERYNMGIMRRGDPYVSDAGFIQLEDEKIAFKGGSGSCGIEGNPEEARKETIRFAKYILGNERVADY